MANIEEILLPDVGGEEVEVIEICVNAGDSLEEEEAIITVETEKASMDIPATFAGDIVEIKVSVGDKVKEGDVVCSMSKAGEAEAPVVEEKKRRAKSRSCTRAYSCC
jgi:pyruvate dehydrogenase E2 component (dihydrolipoamide acetyltransferase)